jgi:hypothetical protein
VRQPLLGPHSSTVRKNERIADARISVCTRTHVALLLQWMLRPRRARRSPLDRGGSEVIVFANLDSANLPVVPLCEFDHRPYLSQRPPPSRSNSASPRLSPGDPSHRRKYDDTEDRDMASVTRGHARTTRSGRAAHCSAQRSRQDAPLRPSAANAMAYYLHKRDAPTDTRAVVAQTGTNDILCIRGSPRSVRSSV